MSKLYPPYIEGTIPAFCNSKEGTVLAVPFSMNRAVNKRDVAGFYLKMKTLQSDKYFITLKSNRYDLENQIVYFDLSNFKNKLNIGQFYKIQIAYVESDAASTIGYYSSVGIVKYTSRPNVYIEGLDKNSPNQHSYNYLGCYSQESLGEHDIKDYSEKEYSYRFIIQDKHDNIVADSGWTLHNNSKDINSYESQDEFLYIADFELNQNYYIKYIVRTNNGLEISSPKYRIGSRKSIQSDIKTKPIPILNFDNGYIEINLDNSNYTKEISYEVKNDKGELETIIENIENPVNGSFVLSRRLKNGVWEELYRFALVNEKLSKQSWKDFTVEQGKTYIYAIQEYNDYDLYSERIESEEIYVDFEDAFLFDGKRQLRIRFNPKISSFKTDHLENKIDTIGSKYPFIFRNGNVAYKEFPISGLISYQMDEDNLFGFDEDFVLAEKFKREKYEGTPSKQLEEYKVKTTNLVGYNFSAERDFKLEVLDWLNNGQPKLFRSPSEGNYIVRLLNTSLSPEDTINRLIHTFNSTAYEVAECNYENLNKNGFISIDEPNTLQTRWITIELAKKSSVIRNQQIPYIELMQHKQASSVYFYDMTPGEMVYINGRSIIIGATGSYFIDNGEVIESIGIPSGIVYTGVVTYSYEDSSKNTFDTITNVQIDDVVAHQFIGAYNNIVSVVEDIKTKISNFYYLDFQKREVQKVYPNWTGSNYERENGIIVLYRDTNFTSRIRLYANEASIVQRYNNEIKYLESYYNPNSPKMREMAINAINEQLQKERLWGPLDEYYKAYLRGLISLEQYYEIERQKIEEYNAFIESEGSISNNDVKEYISNAKEVAIEKAKEKHLNNLERIWAGDSSIFSFENPLVLYQYDLPQVELETSHDILFSTGFEKVKKVVDQKTGEIIEGKLTEAYFLVPEEQLKNKYYIKDEFGNYENTLIFDENAIYYVKKPYEFFYDPKQPMFTYITEDTYKRLKEFEENKKREFGDSFEIHNDFMKRDDLIYNNKCFIDDNEIDLTDDIQVQINTLSQFKTIKLNCGVSLTCGYEVQFLEFFDELELEEYTRLGILRKILNSNWKDYNTEIFKELVRNVGIKTDTPYVSIIKQAQEDYDIIYPKFLRTLSYILKEKEVIE